MEHKQIVISRARATDAARIGELLVQVNHVHALLRPDLFSDGCKKYDEGALSAVLKDETRPIFVAKQEGSVIGYAFCIHQEHNGSNEPPHKTLYIDDLCVDGQARGQGVGRALYEYVASYARKNGYYNVTLNVWEGNEDAIRFYRNLGFTVQKYGMEIVL